MKDAVGEDLRLVLIVGYVQCRDVPVLEVGSRHGRQLQPPLHIHGSKRLVQQHHRRRLHQGASKRHALGLTSRQTRHATLLKSRKTDGFKHVSDACP